MRVLSTLFLCALTILVTACSGWFFIKADGQVSKGVNFCFYNKVTDKQPSEFTIVDLIVQRHTDMSAPTWDIGSWKTVWRITGPFSAKCIAYGTESNSFHTMTKALPLIPNSEYRIFVDEYRSPNGASFTFKLNADGLVVTP